MKRLIFALFLAFQAVAFGTLIPASRLVTWTPGTTVGVPSGIPTGRTQYKNAVTEGVDNTGATDVTAAIQALIDACPANQYVYFPAGTYRIDGTIYLTDDSTSIKGAGATTIFDARSSIGIYVGPGSGFSPTAQTPTVTAELVAGATSLTLSSVSGYASGDLILVSAANDATVPVISVNGYEHIVHQVVRVTGVAGSVVSFSPGLFDAMGGGTLAVKVSKTVDGRVHSVGVEDLRVTGENATSLQTGIRFSQAYGSWAKGVTVDQTNNYGIEIFNSLQCEVRQSRVDTRKPGSTSNGGGITTSYASSSLIEDNIVVDYGPMIEVNFGSSGNAFSRNYFGAGSQANTNHAPWNRFNLYEGNVAKGGFLSDGYFGGSQYDTYYNNYALYIVLKRMTYDANVVLNVIGQASTLQEYGRPNISNSSYSGTVTPPTTMWADYGMTATLKTRTDNDNGVITLGTGFALSAVASSTVDLWWDSDTVVQRFIIGTATGQDVVIQPVNPYGTNTYALPTQGTVFSKVGPGNAGYQEWDLAVEARLTKKGNRYGDNVFDSLGGDSAPASLMYGSKPAWLTAADASLSTTFNLQPFDPVTPVAAGDSDIPAGYRYLYQTPPAFSGATINSAGTELSVTLTKPPSIGAGGSGGITTDGGVTWTYARTSGSSLVFTGNRTIGDEETFTVSYTQPGNGFEDSTGNDLASFSDQAVSNASQQSAGSYWVQVLDLGSANNTSSLNNYAAIIQPITIPADGFVTKIRIGVGAGSYAPNVPMKVALLDGSGNVLSTGTSTISASSDYGVILISTVHVTAGTHRIAIFANSNSEPPVAVLTGQAADSSYYSFADYGTWPGSSVTNSGGSTSKFSVGLRLAPDATPSTATATTINVGSFRKL